MNYDTMSVHDLLMDMADGGYLPDIESALRRAVIREASVGEITVEIRESEDELTAPKGSPDRIVTCSERFICQTWIPEGTYALVKKEP